jgi:hypothetical protein
MLIVCIMKVTPEMLILIYLAIALFRLNKIGDSIKCLDRVIKVEPDHELAHQNR